MNEEPRDPRIEAAIEKAKAEGKLGRARSMENLRHAFVPGKSGNPLGRPQRKPFEEEIIRLGTTERLTKVAEKAWEMAEAGNLDAIRFVAQYVDQTKTLEKASLQFLANNVLIT